MDADDDGELSEFERKLRSRMNTLKNTPRNAPQNGTQTLDRRRPSGPAIQAGPKPSRTTDDVGKGGLTLQEELKRRASRRNGPPAPWGGNTTTGANGGPADHGNAPLPARLPSGKKKVPVPPSLKSGAGESESAPLPPGRPSWEPKKNKISDITSKWNPPQSFDQNQDTGTRNGIPGSPASPISPKPPKLKPTPKNDPSNNMLQKFNNRPQNDDLHRPGSSIGGAGGIGTFPERKESVHNSSNPPPLPSGKPPPPFGKPPDFSSSSPGLPSRNTSSRFSQRQNTAQSIDVKPEHVEREDGPPPLIPKRMESFKRENPVPIISHSSEPSWNSGERGGEGQGISNARVKKTASLGRTSEGTSRMSDSRSGGITPVGSSSESDYSGDGHVRRTRQLEARHSTKGNSPVKQGTVKAKPPAVPDLFRKGTITKPPIGPSGGSMADLNATFPKSVKLSDFVESHKHLLPIKVQVLNEVANEGNVELSRNETLYFHLQKKTEVVVLNGEPDLYYIPWSSKIKFGLIYNPIDTSDNVSAYMKLPTAGDIMKLKQLPLVVTAMTRSDCRSPEKSVAEKEILFVKGIVRGEGTGRGKQELHVVNINGEDKFLGTACAGNFTTDPHHMKVHLSTLLSQDIELPQYVIIYPDRELRGLLPHNLSNCPVLLASKMEEVSMLASRGDLKSEASHTDQLLELVSDLNVNIKPIRITVADKNFLRQVNTAINDNFEASDSLSLMQSVRNSSAPLQEYFYNGLLDEASGGISLEVPETSNGQCEFDDKKRNSSGRTSLDENSQFDLRRVSAQEDTLSISSHTSGNLISNSRSPSSMALNTAVDSSTYDAEEDEDKDPDEFYEDISELQDEYQAEKKKIEESVKQKPVEKKSPVPATPATPSSTKGFKLFKTKKKKGKKNEKEKAYEMSPEPTPVPSIIPTSKQDSDSESYDEVKPADDCYFSDNYEDCSFEEVPSSGPPPLPSTRPPMFSGPPGGAGNSPVPPLPSSAPPLPSSVPPLPSSVPPLPASLPPAIPNFDQMKNKVMQRPPVATEIAKKSNVPFISPSNSNSDGEYADADIVTLPEHVKAKKKEMLEGRSHELPSVALPHGPMKNFSGGEPTLSSLNEQVVQLNGEVESLKNEVKRLAGILEKLGFSGEKKLTVEDNLAILKAMSVDGISAMLEAMSLQKYKAVFVREGINGLLFSDLNDITLKEDLKVASKLHRSRLLSIASGKNSPPR